MSINIILGKWRNSSIVFIYVTYGVRILCISICMLIYSKMLPEIDTQLEEFVVAQVNRLKLLFTLLP